MLRCPLVLDIDFTLIHLEFLPNSIEVPGRTRSAWLAPQTIELLGQLQEEFDLILATARSWDGTRWVSEGLKLRGVLVAAVVIEDGALFGKIGALQPMDADFEREKWRAQIEARRENDWPAFEWQNDFQACLVARCNDRENAAQLMGIFARQIEPHSNLRLFRDGRKVYFLPQTADKWNALRCLLGERAENAAGVGDGRNDLCWLREIAHSATFATGAPEVVQSVKNRGGFVSAQQGHRAIEEVLRHFANAGFA